MVENKTRATDASVLAFIDSIEHKQRASDALLLLDIFSEVTQQKAVMWGESIVGYGYYRYRTADNQSHQSLRTGFSPRKQNLALYIMVGFSDLETKLQGLGKYKIGKSCLYFNKLADVDEGVLRDIIRISYEEMAKRYPQ